MFSSYLKPLSLISLILFSILYLLTNNTDFRSSHSTTSCNFVFPLLFMTSRMNAVKSTLFIRTSPKRSIWLTTPFFYNYLTSPILAIPCSHDFTSFRSNSICLLSRFLFSSVYSFIRRYSRCYFISYSIFPIKTTRVYR